MVLAFAAHAVARGTLDPGQLDMLHDPGGWEYLTISDDHAGIQTKHTCFDGRPHPEECSGTLTLNPDNSFVQQVHIHGQTVARHGNYELDGTRIAFYDEFGTRDGPYELTIDTRAKKLILEMPQVRAELKLEKEYRKQRKQEQAAPAQ